jgi:DNA adenine methylase
VPKVLSTLRDLRIAPRVFVDPFLGGGSVPLAALVEGHVDQAILCEIDSAVASVWKAIFSRDYRTLCNKILNFDITRENVIEALSCEVRTTLDKAFQTIVRNRTFRGGILASGASLVKVGENGRGVASRWYPETLVRRIELLHEYSDKVTFVEGDGMALVNQFAPDPSAFIFVDPPYTAGAGKRAGSRLYDHSDLDHEELFSTLALGQAQFMMTYDDDIDVLRLAERNCFMLQHIAMKNTHHRRMSELLITRA